MSNPNTDGLSSKGNKHVDMEMVEIGDENYLKIINYDAMRPFFMSIVSDSNHWLFIASNGGLTAGRRNPEYALFPYYTEDKIIDSAESTGSKSIFQIYRNSDIFIWEPFSVRFADRYTISRNLYKSVYGNKLIFEEINHDLGLVFRYHWNSSKIFGFVRKAELINTSAKECQICILDGIQNIMPYGVPSDLQCATSNLVDAYKRTELESESGLGIFALSAIISDKAEPSEALKANVAWSLGLENASYLLSSLQLDRFRQKQKVQTEYVIKGEKGAYFVSSEIELPGNSGKTWEIIANVNQNHSQIISLSHSIKKDDQLRNKLLEDIDTGTQNLVQLVAGADGLQCTADMLNDTRHFSSVLFNIMRGGTFDFNYQVKYEDFYAYLVKANHAVASGNHEFIRPLGNSFSLSQLRDLLLKSDDADFIRLAAEYLPLKFSRRHGDPSRPWNYFTINTRDEKDGSEILDYEGNWRDIFQNWEALAHSFPGFIDGMIFKFLNASTFDGYNPYRVTRDGFDWETIEPDNPWSYIGYWGDHQIIYLLKLLEIKEKFFPGTVQMLFDKEWFVYAAVPYIIRPYDQILNNPKETIDFDPAWDLAIRKDREKLGADGALLTNQSGEINHVNFIEKILATLLAKVSGFIPEAGIWMNTQRPEWNDANNALVGNGVSMVTLYYMHRFLKFFHSSLSAAAQEKIRISSELTEFYHSIRETLLEFRPLLTGKITDRDRKTIVDRMGLAASEYRQYIYRSGFRGKKRSVSVEGLRTFIQVSLEYIEHSIRANQRNDMLFHSYNLMSVHENAITYTPLDEMLEGQVAVLSSGYLSPEDSLKVLDALKNSELFREDQYSYILYPNRDLPGFLEKNKIPAYLAETSELFRKMMEEGNKSIIEEDIHGVIHFNGDFKNAGDLAAALNGMAAGEYRDLVEKERVLVLGIFEKVFNHKAFTGRSGTFYSYEGLGSIYWHMVSKLLLAVQECCWKAMEEKADPAVLGRLLDHYYEIEAGIGVHKTPGLYGAFPTDPYSHTPQHRGAQQPGMTGQVKEDILARFGELGILIRDGQIVFHPFLLRKEEFLKKTRKFEYLTTGGEKRHIILKDGQLGFTFCQVPVIYELSDNQHTIIYYADGRSEHSAGNRLSQEISSLIFSRNGEIDRMEVYIRI